MNYINNDPKIHNMNNQEKHEFYKVSHRLHFKEEFDWKGLKPGDMTIYPGARFLIDKFFYQDQEYLVWDYSTPKGWFYGVESMTEDIVPQGLQ